MHTYVEIKGYGDYASIAINDAFHEMARVNSLLNNFAQVSGISLINSHPGGDAVSISPETLEALQTTLKFAKHTGRTLDITIGSLLRLWGFAQEKPSINGTEASLHKIMKICQLVEYSALQLQQSAKNVAFTACFEKKACG
jgi:thiamine biosynthesis lipoprotein